MDEKNFQISVRPGWMVLDKKVGSVETDDHAFITSPGKIVMSGDLDDTIFPACEAALKDMSGDKWIIDAGDCRLHVGGEPVWMRVVGTFLKNCQLIYLPSVLAMNLQYDDTYSHRDSKFLDAEEESGGTMIFWR